MSKPRHKAATNAGLSDPFTLPRYLTQRELADRWRISPRTLERWRAEGYGPPWIVLGGSIRYRLGDIETFEARHRHGESSDAVVGSVDGGAE